MNEAIADKYNEYRAALAILKELTGDFTPEGEQLFLKWSRRCQELKSELWYAEHREFTQQG